MFGLYFDGNLRRIYEVPEDSNFTINAQGYRSYVPADLAAAQISPAITTTDLWSRWVDWHSQNLWSTLAMSKSGGAFREFDSQDNPVFALFDLRLTNDWEIVPADYTHQPIFTGNLYPNIATGRDFDTGRIQSQGVSPRIDFADRGQTTVSSSGFDDGDRIALQSILDKLTVGREGPVDFTEADRERIERIDETLQSLNANNP